MRPTPGSTAGQDPGASATTFFPSKLSLSQHACLVVLFFSFWYRNRHHTVNQRCLPVEVTRTRCRNSFLNKFTTIRPPNLWIATRPGRLSHTSFQVVEADCLSTRFIYTFIRFLDPKYFSWILNIFPFPFSQQRIQGAD